MKVKIAVVQFDTKQYDPVFNLEKSESFIMLASRKKADVIIFPEDFLTGPILNRDDLVDRDHKFVKSFSRLAKKYKIDIVAGSFIEQNKKGLFNSCYYVDSRGIIKNQYNKINLWLPERRYLSAGNKISVFNTRFGRAGLIICWDLMFPEIFRKMIRNGVQIVYCVSWWSRADAKTGLKYDENAEKNLVNTLCQTRAMENGIILVYCNAAGVVDIGKYHDDLIGQSQICLPFKGVQKILAHNNEEMFIEEVNTDILKDHEKAYQIKADLKHRTVQ